MATVGEAIAATLIAQWNVGTGGTQPDPIQYLVERPERDPNPTVADAIYVWLPLKRVFDPIDVAEVYRNVTYTIRIVCHTKTSSARQLEIENEVDRILNSGTVITGATRQRVKEINDISNRSYSNLPKYISEVIVEVFTAMEVSATAYGTATTTTLTTDDLIVNTSITVGGLDIEEALMLGSANAAWQPCTVMHESAPGAYTIGGTGYIRNATAVANQTMLFSLPLPTNKSSLKLYVTGVRVIVNDADATNYIDSVTLYGVTETGLTNFNITDGAVDRTAQGDYEYALADSDASSYDNMVVVFVTDTANIANLDFGVPFVSCFYAA